MPPREEEILILQQFLRFQATRALSFALLRDDFPLMSPGMGGIAPTNNFSSLFHPSLNLLGFPGAPTLTPTPGNPTPSQLLQGGNGNGNGNASNNLSSSNSSGSGGSNNSSLLSPKSPLNHNNNISINNSLPGSLFSSLSNSHLIFPPGSLANFSNLPPGNLLASNNHSSSSGQNNGKAHHHPHYPQEKEQQRGTGNSTFDIIALNTKVANFNYYCLQIFFILDTCILARVKLVTC